MLSINRPFSPRQSDSEREKITLRPLSLQSVLAKSTMPLTFVKVVLTTFHPFTTPSLKSPISTLTSPRLPGRGYVGLIENKKMQGVHFFVAVFYSLPDDASW